MMVKTATSNAADLTSSPSNAFFEFGGFSFFVASASVALRRVQKHHIMKQARPSLGPGWNPERKPAKAQAAFDGRKRDPEGASPRADVTQAGGVFELSGSRCASDVRRDGASMELHRPMSLSSLVALLLTTAALVSSSMQKPSGSLEARSHLAEIISVLEKEWLHRDRMDWDDFRKQVFQRAGAAQTVPETYDAIRLALSLLADKHSYYITQEGKPIFNPASPTQSTRECTPKPAVGAPLPPDVAYIRVQITPATPTAEIQDALRKGDREGIAGWIVDLRNSRGGNMWPAVAGLGPLLGEGTAGFFVDAGKAATPWGYTDGKAWLGENTVAQAERPYKLRASDPRVAILTDIGVASSGEAIAIGFRGRRNTRSFGTRTCGLSTAVQQFPLKRDGVVRPFGESARIAVVTSLMADRTKKEYGGAVTPDETITEPTEVVSRAVEWLRQN
jgi:C-terminal processing protease CtpA/Prc